MPPRYPTRKSAITHCARGHKLSGQNLYRKKSRRHCKACRKEADAARYERDRDLLIDRKIAWLHDMPAIIAEADRRAGLPTSTGM